MVHAWSWMPLRERLILILVGFQGSIVELLISGGLGSVFSVTI